MSSLGAIPILLVAAVAVVEAARAVASVRRGRRLQRAMHELRRPLQALSLIVERGASDSQAARACMEQARVAMAELGAIVDRAHSPLRRRTGELADVIDALGARWRGAGVEVGGAGLDGSVADPERLGAALDNLVANAIEHGGRPVSVSASHDGGAVRVEVRDAGAVTPRPRRRDPRRGHGLPIVRELAAASGGSVEIGPDAADGGTRATIRIPVSRQPGPGPDPGMGTGPRDDRPRGAA